MSDTKKKHNKINATRTLVWQTNKNMITTREKYNCNKDGDGIGLLNCSPIPICCDDV